MSDTKLSYREAIKLNYRSITVWQKFCPGLFLSILLSSGFEALSPYVTIWLSARIIGELAGRRNPQELLRLVILQLASEAILALAGGIVNRWKNYKHQLHLRQNLHGKNV